LSKFIVFTGKALIKSASVTQSPDSEGQESILVKRAVSGDSSAFASLYEIYIDDVYRFILHRVGHEQTAEDLTSQVFLKAWDKLGRYEIRGLPFGAWLFQIARNSVIDYYRTYKETLPLEHLNSDPAVNVAKEVEKQLEGEWLRTVLQHLTEDQREVLVLKFINGLKTQEIAQVMGKRQGAIRALQMRALQALAEILGEDDE
jgi:RNA polymerase sigma-70 factor (ECF subfamily)